MNKPSSTVDRLALMQTFIRIVEAGSLSAAAKQLNTTQPTISRRLRSLEQSLGLRLLQRSTHALSLTEAGSRCFERAKTLLQDWEQLQGDLRGTQQEPEGLLRVQVPHALGQLQLIPPVLALLQRAPKLSIEWLLDDKMPQFIAQGIDCAIHVGPLGEADAVALQISAIPRVLVAAPALLEGRQPPESPDALQALDWIALSTFYRHELPLHNDGGARFKLSLRPRFITDSLFALRNAALAGVGAAAISGWLVREDIEAGRLLQLLPQWRAPSLPVHLLHPYQSAYPAKLRHFVSAMRDSLNEPLWPATAMLMP